MKIQEERKASTNLLALQEHIPTTWEHGPKNWSENRSSAVQSKPDRKKATASQASEQRSGKNSPERRRQQREEKQTNSERKHNWLVYIKEHQKQHTRRTATPPPPPAPPPNPPSPPPNDPPPTPPPTPPPNTNRPTPNFGMSSGTMPWNSESMEMHFAMNTRINYEVTSRMTRMTDVRNAQNDPNYGRLAG